MCADEKKKPRQGAARGGEDDGLERLLFLGSVFIIFADPPPVEETESKKNY